MTNKNACFKFVKLFVNLITAWTHWESKLQREVVKSNVSPPAIDNLAPEDA